MKAEVFEDVMDSASVYMHTMQDLQTRLKRVRSALA